MAGASAGRCTLGVVVPTLDEAALIPALVRRLCHARGDPLDCADQVIVADGGSRDDTADRARSAGARVILAARGRGQQLASGADAATTDLLLFLHADTCPDAGALRAVRAAFGDEAFTAGAMHQRIDAAGLFYRCVERAADGRVRRAGIVFGDSGLVVRRALYRAVGGFRSIPILEDVDLSRRLLRRARPQLIPGATLRVSARRWEREGALRTTLRNWILRLAYRFGTDPWLLERHYAPHRERLSP